MAAPLEVVRWSPFVDATLHRRKLKDLHPNLVLAVIWQESSGNPWAWNPEGPWKYFWNVKTSANFRKVTDAERASENPPADFPTLIGDPDQEWWAQQASWGLMQVMGAVARERGFRGVYLPEIYDPATNIEIGIQHLWIWGFKRGHVSTQEGLLRYNGGGNPNYAKEVLAKRFLIEKG